MAMTESELLMQEKLDNDVYTANRNMFEHLMLMMTAGLRMGTDESEKIKLLLETYNSTSEGCQRLVGKIRRLENEKKVVDTEMPLS
jgi:hypothetical protein